MNFHVKKINIPVSLLAMLLFFNFSTLLAQFSRIPGDKGLGWTSAQSGGQAWGDLNNDGYQDVIIHADRHSSKTPAKLYINDGPPNFTFTDATSSLIAGFNDWIGFGRQMLVADFNNDGYNDVLRGPGSNSITEIYYNNGPPTYDFGTATQQPDVSITNMPDGNQHNVEGIGAIDWNQDGWLDLIFDNDAGGNDIFENDKAGGFTYIYPGTGAGQTGFAPSHSGDGDYLTVADVNNDGFVDFYGRKTAVSNYWRFDPSISQFVNQATPNIVSKETDKGGTMFCDFDNDGDLDLFWTSFGVNQIWRYDGKNTSGDGIWTATGIPGGAIGSQTGIDGCDCGDVDNDGDLDIVLGASSGNSYLLTNQLEESGSMTFNASNIATNANTESTVLVDFDDDGDLDLYFVADGTANQLWENSTNNSNYLYVNAMYDNGGSTRNAIGASVMLTDCQGVRIELRQVNGGKGHGAQHQTKVHFGLDPGEQYMVSVYFVNKNGSRSIVRRMVVPNGETNQEITILDTDVSDISPCLDPDGDGILNSVGIDDDNDGIPDVMEVCGPGATDYSCLDAILFDGSGNGLDPTGDEDGDGILNYRDSDDPSVNHAFCEDLKNDGLCDSIPIIYDYDGDNVLDFFDLDSDNDGIPDIVEAGGVDTDGDGRVDFPTPGDPLSVVDLDADGLADIYDDTDNGGGTPGWVSGTSITLPDTDGDGLVDHLDLDADNDGIPDIVEAGGADDNGDGLVDSYNPVTGIFSAQGGNNDPDNDGYANSYDSDSNEDYIIENPANALILTGSDTDSDGVPNSYSKGDTDGDGKIDSQDLDADNDGIPDLIEAGGSDTDGNGMVDGSYGSGDLNEDTDSDGWADIFDAFDSDIDDADVVAGTAMVTPNTDVDNDGLPDPGSNGGLWSSGDFDGDGIPNHLDLDADNDGVPDVVEAGGIDTDGDGVADSYVDADRDGFHDAYDPFDNDPSAGNDVAFNASNNILLVFTNADTNGDGLGGITEGYGKGDLEQDGFLNMLDLDADNDGILDIIEAGGVGADTNNDGMVDNYNPGTGVYAPGGDPENDGYSSLYDTDDDNDGTSSGSGTALVLTGLDADSDGLIDDYLTGDTDDDARPDFLDVDADNDGILDNIEAQATGNAVNVCFVEPAGTYDAFGVDTNYGSYQNCNTSNVPTGAPVFGITPYNHDGDSNPDYKDTDSDGDNMPDKHEAWDLVTDGDAVNDYDYNANCTSDNDGDGLLNCFDSDDSDPTITVANIPPDDNGHSGATSSSGFGSGNSAEEIFPNNGGDSGEIQPDWRDDQCITPSDVFYSFDETQYIYNIVSDLHEVNASQNFGTNRATQFCANGSWTYYFNPLETDKYLFSIEHGTNTVPINYVTIRKEEFPANRQATNATNGYFVMERDWNVETVDNDPLTGNVNVRFYFPQSDSIALDVAARAFATANGLYAQSPVWFKADNGGTGGSFDNSDITPTGVTGATILSPAAYGTENGRHYVQFNGISSFSGGTLAIPVNITPFDVGLVDFEAKLIGKDAYLNWKSEVEINADFFSIERSMDGRNFGAIGQVSARGTNGEGADYFYNDPKITSLDLPTLFYRLKMVDADGTFEYSPIVELNLGDERAILFDVFPNPVIRSGMLKVRFSKIQDASMKLRILNPVGQVVFAKELTRSVNNVVNVPVESWTEGVYFVQIISLEKTATKKITVK